MKFHPRCVSTIEALLRKHPNSHTTSSSLISSIEKTHPMLIDKLYRFISEKKAKHNKIEISLLLANTNEFLEFISTYMPDENKINPITKTDAVLNSDTHRVRASTTHCLFYSSTDDFVNLRTAVISEDSFSIFPKTQLNTKCVLIENLEVFHHFKSTHHFSQFSKHCDIIYGSGNDVLNKYKVSFFSHYSEVVCFFDYDCAGLDFFFSLREKIANSQVSFFIPDDIKKLFENARPDFNHKLNDKIRNLATIHGNSMPQLNCLITLMDTYRRGVEQENCLL
jgi:hypothetical protein